MKQHLLDAGHFMNLLPEGTAKGRVKERRRVADLKWLEDAVLQAAKDMYASWKRRGSGPEPSLTTSLLRDLAIEGTGGLPEDIKWMTKRQQDLAVLNVLQKLKRKGLMEVSTGMGQRGKEAHVWNPVSASTKEVVATLLAVADYLDSEVSASTYNAKARYKFLNDKLFDGKLPDIPITMRNLKRVGGHASAKVLRNANGDRELVPGSVKITLDSTYKRTQEQQDAILAHEMIHVYNYVHGNFSETHGLEFLAMARKLETILGTPIPLTDETKGLELEDSTVKPVGVVMMLAGGNQKPEDGRWVLALMNEKALRKSIPFFESRRAAGPMLIGVSTDPYWVKKSKALAEQRTTNLNFYYAEPEAEAALRKGEILLDQTGQQKVAADFKRPHDAWKGLKKGVQPLPQPLEGHEKAWAKIATRLGIDGARGVIQLAPVIGGRRRYHHRPLSSWLLPDKKTTLTLTTDKLEGQSWNRLKNKRHVAMPRIYDVFELRLSGVREPLWAIVHERVTWPVDQDWDLFVDTFFRWRAMQKDALKPAQASDLEDFLRFIIDPKQADPVTTQRRRVETALPFGMMNDRRADIAARRKAVWKDPGLQQKIAWAKSTLKFLRENKIKHRDLDPSNLAKTLKGRTVVTNVAESRSKGHKIGRLGRVSSAVLPVEHDPFGPTPAAPPLRTAQAVNFLLDPEAPLMEQLQILSTETRNLVMQIHQDADMRAAVQEAAFKVGFPPEMLLAGLEKLAALAEKSGGKSVYIAEACMNKLGKGIAMNPPLPMMGVATTASTSYYKKKRQTRRVGKMQKIIDSLVEDPSAEAEEANDEIVQALRAAADHLDPVTAATTKMDIKLTYRSIDGVSKSARFKTLEAAQRFAQRYVGATPELGTGYAVSGDGVGKITWQGCTATQLFPKLAGHGRHDEEMDIDYEDPSDRRMREHREEQDMEWEAGLARDEAAAREFN